MKNSDLLRPAMLAILASSAAEVKGKGSRPAARKRSQSRLQMAKASRKRNR